SRNGTWINGGRIFHATLRNGDQLRLGATDLKFEVLFGDAKAE
ncbi:MAG: FHA domain-containing protein, partial [Thermoanaerobaculia bacterium]